MNKLTLQIEFYVCYIFSCEKNDTSNQFLAYSFLLWPIAKDASNPLSNQNSKKLRKARENWRERVTISFGFTCDWLRKWREFFKPITERSSAKPK